MKNNLNKMLLVSNKHSEVFIKNINNYIHSLMGIVGGLALFYGIAHTIEGKSLLGAVDLTVGVLLLGLLLVGLKLSQKIKSIFLAVLLQIFLLFLVYHGATGNVGYLWMIIYPSVVLYLLGIGLGMFLVGLSCFFLILLSVFHFVGIISLPYDGIAIIQYSVVYGVMSLLSFLAEKDRQNRKEVVELISNRLSFVIKNSPVIAFVLDNEGKILFLDGAGLSKLKLKSEKIVGASAIEIYRDVPGMLDGIKTALSGSKIDKLLWIGEFAFQTRFSPILDGGGVMGLAIDVTEEQKNNNAMSEKIGELEKLNKLMVGRELKMAEMKQKISLLSKSLNEHKNVDI